MTKSNFLSDSDLAHEIADRQYVGTEAMKQSDYVLGQAWVAITVSIVEAEKITAENAPNVAASTMQNMYQKQ